MNSLLSNSPRYRLKNQAGMVLLLCLIFLTALTLLGLSASAEAILQNQLAANLQEAERAKQSALSALSWAEDWVLGLDGTTPETCSTACDGLKIHAQGGLPVNPEFNDLSWWLEQGHEAGIDPLTGELVSKIAGNNINPPVWIIEAVHEISPTESGTTDLQVWYRILARGNGRTDAGISVVESIVVRSWTSIENTEPAETGIPGRCPGAEPDTKCGRISWRELR
jgi:Tfp pilus assembly protein PilX